MAVFKGYKCDYCGTEVREPNPLWFGVVEDAENQIVIGPLQFDDQVALCKSRCVIGYLEAHLDHIKLNEREA